ncbi:hypothetical protein ACVGVM_16275 [Pseudonocardia bannensis]|uniref:Uncharacterized protein n=1 Tax=Pseudonocardia bannensis TaxID=630973 RepID=A0A848DL14_9PSEU|nr:hypothetical protein [Pseudonocardia bannensis]NMH93255.1 hypothetical protein [Pseudonocardia bannensis]
MYPPADPGRLLPGPLGEPVEEPVSGESAAVEPPPGEPVAGEPAAEPVPGEPVAGEPVLKEPGPTDPNPAPVGVPATPPPASTPPASVPTTPPEASGPPSAAEVLGLGREALVPVGKPDGDLPEAFVGTGLGLWTGGTGTPVVLVLGTEHKAGAVLAVRGREASRPLVLFYGDNRYHDHVLGDPHVLTRAEAVDLLAATRAPVVLLLGLTADTVTVVEAAVVGTR